MHCRCECNVLDFHISQCILHEKYIRNRFQLNIVYNTVFIKCYVCFGCLDQVGFLLEFNRCFVFASYLLACSLPCSLCLFLKKWAYLFNHRDLLVCFDFFIFSSSLNFKKTKWEKWNKMKITTIKTSKSNNYLKTKLFNQSELHKTVCTQSR